MNLISQEELKNKYVEEIIEAEYRNRERKDIYEYLGAFAAEAEWNKNPNEANKRFLNVSAYKKFRDDYYLGLVGRTGTGKTSIIRKILNAIKNNENNYFKHGIELSLKDYILYLPNYANINESIKEKAEVERNLTIYINICVMRYVMENRRMFEKGKNIVPIEKYLKEQGIGKNTDIIRKIFDILSNAEQGNSVVSAVGILAKVSLAFSGESYDNALDRLHEILDNESILVVIDTIEQYDIRDEQLKVIMKALIQVSSEFSWNFDKNKIFVKYALPSEIYTQIRSLLPAKLIGRIISIEWNYKDLVKMIAVKFFCYASTQEKFFSFIKNYQLKDLYENPQTAINIMYEILPQMCPATIALKFDTLAYYIRHTQKKPRQLLLIVDALLNEIMEKNDENYLKKNVDQVRHIIHSVQEEMIMDSIAMYRDSIPALLQICCDVLNGKNYCFSAKEFDGYIRAVKKIYKQGLSLDEIKRVIIESGLVGIEENGAYIPENSKWFENKKVIRIMNTSFEYQIKGNLVYNNDSIMYIHPMCYEYFKCKISRYTMVYPDRNADPDDILNDVLEFCKENNIF